MSIDDDPPVYLASGVFYERNVGPDSHGYHEDIEVDGPAALHERPAVLEIFRRIAQNERDVFLFDMLLNDPGALAVEYGRKYPRRQIRHRDRADPPQDALRALKTDKAGPHYQDLLVL